MSFTPIAEIPKSESGTVRIVREDRDDGRIRLHVREWFQDANHEWRPGRNGIVLKVDQVHAVVAGLLNAVSGKGRR